SQMMETDLPISREVDLKTGKKVEGMSLLELKKALQDLPESEEEEEDALDTVQHREILDSTKVSYLGELFPEEGLAMATMMKGRERAQILKAVPFFDEILPLSLKEDASELSSN